MRGESAGSRPRSAPRSYGPGRPAAVRRLALLGLGAALALPAAPARSPAQESGGEAAADTGRTAAPAPKPDSSVTRHSIEIGGQTVRYTAKAGYLILHDDEGEPTARIGYVAYTRDGVGDLSRRPVTFAYNGGPGSSSVWLHMGALGPRRVVTPEADFAPPPPYRIVDNAFSVLDVTDLVMIDPVGTGVSKALGKKKDEDFWGTDPDIASVSAFIKEYVSRESRWNSPKYLLGESYGTTRSAGVVDHLQSHENMAFNGVILVSVALDLESIFDEIPGNDRPYPLFLPSYAAVAYYHHALPERPDDLDAFLQQARDYALGPYEHALAEGSDLSDAARDSVARRLHDFTGLSVDYIEKADLRVREGEFGHELLREHRQTVGRLDARFLGPTLDPLAQFSQYDPQSAAVSSAFTAAFLHYYHDELKFGRDLDYAISGDSVYGHWMWKHHAPGGTQQMANTVPDLGHAMTENPNLQVLVLNGIYDLATPFLATESTMSHLGLPPDLRPHVKMKYYEAGHMMYLHEASLERMKSDVASFIRSTSGGAGSAGAAGEG